MSTDAKFSIDHLQKQLNIFFKQPDILEQAITHSSFVKYKGSFIKPSLYNERLEFFGDSVLKFIVSDYLFHKHPDFTEGDLSKLRSKIISDRFLAGMARAIQLGDYLKLSHGEKKAGANDRLSTLADAFEALLGACYIDQGLDVVKSLFFSLFEPAYERLLEGDFDDYKSNLQEICQKRKLALPSYQVVKEEGPDHDKVFTVEAVVQSGDIHYVTQGVADSKKQAEQLAAKEAYLAIKQEKHS